MKFAYMATDRCNAACSHCYKRKADCGEKSVETCKQEVAAILQAGHEVIIAGREILCDPQKLELYRLVGQDYVLTNGIILSKDEGILRRIGECGIKKIRISWHFGFSEISPELHEEMTIRAIRNALRHGYEVQVNCVVGNRNLDCPDGMCKQAVELGVSEIIFLRLLTTNDEVAQYRLTDKQTAEFISKVAELRKMHDRQTIRIRLHPNFDAELSERSIRAKQEGSYCPAGRSYFTIDTDNAVYPCPFLMHDRYRIGSFQNNSIELINRVENDGKGCLCKGKL